jgi:hypothetical protein
MEHSLGMKMRTLAIFSTVVLFLAGAPRTHGFEDGSFEAVTADVLVVRPVSFVATVLGTGLFIVSLPMAAISKSIDKTAEALVLKPGRMTFTRPLGDLSDLTN